MINYKEDIFVMLLVLVLARDIEKEIFYTRALYTNTYLYEVHAYDPRINV